MHTQLTRIPFTLMQRLLTLHHSRAAAATIAVTFPPNSISCTWTSSSASARTPASCCTTWTTHTSLSRAPPSPRSSEWRAACLASSAITASSAAAAPADEHCTRSVLPCRASCAASTATVRLDSHAQQYTHACICACVSVAGRIWRLSMTRLCTCVKPELWWSPQCKRGPTHSARSLRLLCQVGASAQHRACPTASAAESAQPSMRSHQRRWPQAPCTRSTVAPAIATAQQPHCSAPPARLMQPGAPASVMTTLGLAEQRPPKTACRRPGWSLLRLFHCARVHSAACTTCAAHWRAGGSIPTHEPLPKRRRFAAAGRSLRDVTSTLIAAAMPVFSQALRRQSKHACAAFSRLRHHSCRSCTAGLVGRQWGMLLILSGVCLHITHILRNSRYDTMINQRCHKWDCDSVP
jgi:hypothetical protein